MIGYELNENQINELYGYLKELIKDMVITMEQFLIFIGKAYKDNKYICNEEMFVCIKKSIEKVARVLNES